MANKAEMIENQLQGRNITDREVLRAMKEVDRTKFVPEEYRAYAYDDRPLPIGKDQTISQPYIVAYMAQALEISTKDKILEIGTGCGYNAAVLSRIASHVYSIEIIEWLGELAKENLHSAGMGNLTTKFGDGFEGWPEHAPFDGIVLTAATPLIPRPLKDQLKTGGRMLAPVGEAYQQLKLLEKTGENSFEASTLLPVRFVPMTGKAQN